ncbi:MAG: glycerol-3-phosphate 1-O-acyltransferase PlsY [Gammaproteobacteria bacterium]
MLELGIKVLISYLLGSLNGSLILGKFKGVDIRASGSGNAGGTNALRTQGALFAFFVMVIDVGKGWLPVALLPTMAIPGVPIDPDVSRTWLTLACGAAVIVGHCYPVWFNFAGGKGAATTLGVLIAIAPVLLLPAGITFVAVLVLTGYVGLATMSAALAMPLWVAATDLADSRPLFVFLTALALFIVFTHRSNIQRLREGTESRSERVMLFRRRKAERGDAS